MQPSATVSDPAYLPPRFPTGKIQTIAITALMLGTIALGWELHRNGMEQPAGLAAGVGAIGLGGWSLWILQLFRQHEQSLRQFQEQQGWGPERAAQLSETNALLREEVHRTRQAIAALEMSEARLKIALDATQTVIWDLNLATGEVERSENVAALFGTVNSPLEGTQAGFLKRVHPDDRARTQRTTAAAIAQQGSLYQEYRVIWDDSSIHWIASRGQFQRDQQDSTEHLVGTMIDITQQKWVEEELRLTQKISQAIESAPTYQACFEAMLRRMCEAIDWDYAEAWLPSDLSDELTLSAVCCEDCAPHLQDFVAASQALTVSRNLGLPGRVWATQQAEWLLDLPQQSVEQFLRRDLVKPVGFETALGIPPILEGQTIGIFLFFSFTPRRPDDRTTSLLNTLIDRLSAALQRKRVEEKLQESYTLMKTVFDSTPDPIFVKDLQGRFCLVNRAITEILGATEAEILGRTDADFLPSELVPALREVDQRVVTSGNSEMVEEKVYWEGTVHHFLSTKSVWRNRQGDTIGLIGVSRNITDRVQDREAITRLNQQLEQRVQERTVQLEAVNKELEAFSYSVSHDLRAPLRSIDGFSQAILTRYHDNLDASGQHYLQRIRVNTHRMGELIDDLLLLSRVTLGSLQSQSVNLSLVAQEIAAQLSATQPDRAVEWTIAPDAVVQGDPRLLKIALENLLGNAWKYTSQKPVAQIEFGVCACSAINHVLLSSVPDPQTAPSAIAYFVRDNGAGFNMAYRNKLFAAFQRLHSDAEFPGTGIGLATVSRIVQRHNGQVGAIGEVDRGATFYFILPSGYPRDEA
jgi:PAS domain S-box-containing protein